MSEHQDPVAETQTEAAALLTAYTGADLLGLLGPGAPPKVFAVQGLASVPFVDLHDDPELFVPGTRINIGVQSHTGCAFHIENPSGDNRTPSRVLIYDAAGRESVLDGVVGFSVDSLRGVLTLDLRPEHLHVEHVANAPA